MEKWCVDNLRPLDAFEDLSIDTWLDSTNYTMSRKQQLKQVYEEHFGAITKDNCVNNKFCKCKMFMKDETYPVYKYPRLINSRHDVFKVRVGPIFKKIEAQLFALPWFIKHTPVDERPTEILRELYQRGARIVGTDYTSFEALFTKELMMSCEMVMYRFMTKNLPDKEWIDIVEKVLTGVNVCNNKYFTAVLNATRMSGEMCTSLGNSFMNLMVFLFLAQEYGLQSVKGRVEGDDAIMSYYGPPLKPEYFEKLGLLIKIVEYDKITEGSFCGIIADEEELINIREPFEALLDYHYTTCQYANAKTRKLRELLRSKALSLVYQYCGCPILDAAARWGLRMTKGARWKMNSKMSVYEKEKFLQLVKKYDGKIPFKPIGPRTRELMHKKFSVTIEEQIHIENIYNNKNDFEPIYDSVILSHCHPNAKDYFKFNGRTTVGSVPPFEGHYRRSKYQSAFLLLNKIV